MFLDWIGTVGLLSHDPESNILREFSGTVKKTIAGQMVNFLLQPTCPKYILSSRAHVKFALECISPSFTLQMEDHSIIASAIELYKRWLLDRDNRPAPINQEEPYFIQVT